MTIAQKGRRPAMTITENATNGTVFSGRTHVKILIGPIIIQAILLSTHKLIHDHLPQFGNEMVDQWRPLTLHGILVLLQLIYVLVPVLRWIMTKFTITSDAVKMSRGLVTRQTREIQLGRITQVEMERNLSDYLFGCGTIVMHEASSQEPVRMVDVPKVVSAKQTLDQLIQT